MSGKILDKKYILPSLLVFLLIVEISLSVSHQLKLVGLSSLPADILTIVLTPLILLSEIIWCVYYAFTGGSLLDLKIRQERGRPYSRLKIDLVGMAAGVLTMFISMNPSWLPLLKNAGQAKLVRHFQEHRNEFENAVTMIKTDKDPYVIQGDLKRLGLCGKYENRGGVISLNLYNDPIWVGAGYFKGYVFSDKKTLLPQVDDIDGGKVAYSTMTFQKIEKNWYLYFYYY
jgi:hypothetical protein